jgi:hypothetical protein
MTEGAQQQDANPLITILAQNYWRNCGAGMKRRNAFRVATRCHPPSARWVAPGSTRTPTDRR